MKAKEFISRSFFMAWLLPVMLMILRPSTLAGQEFYLPDSIENGQKLYNNYCAACHQVNGQGIPMAYPPLTIAELVEDNSRMVKSILEGVPGPVELEGVTYSAPMAALKLTDEQVADILNYVKNSWGNESERVIYPIQIQALLLLKE